MQQNPSHQLTPIIAVNPEAAQFLAAPAQPLKQEPSPSRVRNRSGSDNDGQQQAQGIDQQMSFAPIDLFALVIAPDTGDLSGFDALAIQTARGRVLVTPPLSSHLGAQGVVDPLPRPLLLPLAKIMIDALPVGILLGQHPPL